MRIWDWINQSMVDPRRKTLIIPLCVEIGEFKHSFAYISNPKRFTGFHADLCPI